MVILSPCDLFDGQIIISLGGFYDRSFSLSGNYYTYTNSGDIDFLIQNIRSNEKLLVVKIYLAMANIGMFRPEIVEPLINYAFEDLQSEHPAIRGNALIALGLIGRADTNLVKDRINEIVNLYKDNDARVRMYMVWACKVIAYSKADLFGPYIKIFEEMLDDVDEKYVKKEIPEIFEVIGKKRPKLVEQSLEKLIDKMNNNNKVMRIHVRRAIKIIYDGDRPQEPVWLGRLW